MKNTEQVISDLQAGNRRYALGAGIHPNQTLHRRDEMLAGQNPSAVIIGCSDSRVPPEIIFDCGLGELFVIRTAGHVADESVIASVQYAVEHLHTDLILVLGHSDCGAVKSAVQGLEASGALGALLARIKPPLKAAAARAGDLLESAVIENIRLTLAQLKETAWPRELMIRGACYSLKSGLVTFDPEP